tara:strand:+ start:88 stop:246 length:159 start_codon:yes stop_codon:yes gene_type:complete
MPEEKCFANVPVGLDFVSVDRGWNHPLAHGMVGHANRKRVVLLVVMRMNEWV